MGRSSDPGRKPRSAFDGFVDLTSQRAIHQKGSPQHAEADVPLTEHWNSILRCETFGTAVTLLQMPLSPKNSTDNLIEFTENPLDVSLFLRIVNVNDVWGR